MNMISTGAFLNEMDASNKQTTVAEKFAAVWEKKNAKAARAGGVSLMALSLAACGSSSTTTSTSTTDTSTTTTTTSSAKTLKVASDADVVAGTSGNDTFNATAFNSFGDKGDSIVDTSSSDADVLNAFVGNLDTNKPSVSGVETVNYTLGTNSTMTPSLHFGGATSINLSASGNGLTATANGASGTIGLTNATVLGSTGYTPSLTTSAAVSGTTNTLTVEVTGAASTSGVTINTDANTNETDIDQLTIVSSGTTANVVTLSDSFVDATTESITVDGSADLTIKMANASVGAADGASAGVVLTQASTGTGKVTLELTDGLTDDEDLVLTKATGVDKLVLKGLDTDAADGHNISGLVNGVEVEFTDDVANSSSSDNLVLSLSTAGEDAASRNTATVIMNNSTSVSTLDGGLEFTGIEDLTIESGGTLTGTAATTGNSIASLVTGTAGSKVTITGGSKLTISSTTDAQVTTIDASGNTAGVDLTIGAANALTFTGTAAADRVDIGAIARLTTDDQLTGGDGNDILATSAADLTAANVTLLNNASALTGFETLESTATGAVGGTSFDVSLLTGYTTFVFSGTTGSDNVSISGLKEGDTVKFTADDGGNSSDKTLQAAIDNGSNTINIVYDDAGGDSQDQGATDLTDFETINISTDHGVSFVDGTADPLKIGINATVNLTGKGEFEVGVVEDSSAGTNFTWNASTFTGTLLIEDDAAGTGTGNNTITGGTGDDTIKVSEGIDTVDLSSGGTDTVHFANDASAFTAANRNIIKGGTYDGSTGTDAIVFATNITTDGDVSSSGIAASEVTTFTSAAATYDHDDKSLIHLEFEFSSSVDLDSDLTGTTLLSAMGAATGTTAGAITADATTDVVLIMAYQDGNGYLYRGTGTGDSKVNAGSEVALVGVFEGMAVGEFIDVV